MHKKKKVNQIRPCKTFKPLNIVGKKKFRNKIFKKKKKMFDLKFAKHLNFMRPSSDEEKVKEFFAMNELKAVFKF